MFARCSFAFIVTCTICSCEQSQSSTAGYDAEFQRQVEIYNEQTSRTNAQLDLNDEFMARHETLYKKWEEQTERQDVLLDRWEKQADREDRLHDALEKLLTDQPTRDPE